MTPSDFRDVSSPFLWTARCPRGRLTPWVRSGTEVVWTLLRGRKCRDAARFFDEAAAALQFPDYFGENWSAFKDCLEDLRETRSPSPGEAVPLALIVNQASLLLADDEEQLGILLDVFESVAGTWQQGLEGYLPPTPLKLVLQEDGAHMEILQERLLGCAAEPADLAIP